MDFWAEWCGPCHAVSPVLEKIADEHAGELTLVKVNIDENQEIAQQLRIQSIPTVYAFKNGQPVDGFMGAIPESQLRAFVQQLTGGAAGASQCPHRHRVHAQGRRRDLRCLQQERPQRTPLRPL